MTDLRDLQKWVSTVNRLQLLTNFENLLTFPCSFYCLFKLFISC